MRSLVSHLDAKIHRPASRCVEGWLRQRFGLPLRREPDEAGIFDGLAAVFESLARDVRV